ncbi:MAG: DNA-binding protein [Candidatus Brockarchaeota archaeon]|nr:DNA-binding protein [Candidatus Brockarchaeota archaeon]
MDSWEAGLGRIIVLRGDRGEDLLETIETAARANRVANSVIISAIGTLENCRMHRVTSRRLPPEEEYVDIDGPLEINSVSGIIANGRLHAHISVSNGKGTYGGHLEPGSRILYLAEIVVAEITGVSFNRVRDVTTGLSLLRAV